MTNTYVWNIKKLDAKSIGNQANVVYNIHWDLKISDGKNAVEVSGIQGVPFVEGQPFTPYESLSKDQVISWIINFPVPEGVTSIFEILEAKLASMSTATPESASLSWVNDNAELKG
jgi:hypothetical protein